MPASYLIVGGGNFGWATALELLTQDHLADVTLVDYGPRSDKPHSRAASHDKSKIVRPDYADPLYTKLMLEAMPKWRCSDLYRPWYHQTGMIRLDAGPFNDGCIESYKKLGERVLGGYLPVEEAKTRWKVLLHANFEGVKHCYYNAESGWADATGALNAVIKEAHNYGIKYREADVKRLLLTGGACQGVVLADEERIFADNVLLCTGARTALLLAESAPMDSGLQAGKRLTATGAVCYAAELYREHWQKYKGAPVVKNGLEHTTGEVMPLDENTGVLKSNFEMSFTHKEWHESSGQEISIPPGALSESMWCAVVPESLRNSARQVVLNTYGADIERYIKSETWRMCWDVSTPSHDFLISPHPRCQNLFIATGGSFHGWKFLPVIGKYIVQMLRNRLDPEKVDRWGWDGVAQKGRGRETANHTYKIKKDLKDVDGWKEIAPKPV